MDLFFNGAVNGDWSTLGNWWQDAGFTIPAESLPAEGDTVYIENILSTKNESTPVSLAAIYVGLGNGPAVVDFETNGQINGTWYFAGSSQLGFNGYIVGDVDFRDYSICYGGVYGSVTFADVASHQSGTISGQVSFFGDSVAISPAAIDAGGGYVTFEQRSEASDLRVNYAVVEISGPGAGNVTINATAGTDTLFGLARVYSSPGALFNLGLPRVF